MRSGRVHDKSAVDDVARAVGDQIVLIGIFERRIEPDGVARLVRDPN